MIYKIETYLVIILFSFISIVSSEPNHNISNVVEKYNDYVIQNSLISAKNLKSIIDNPDIKIIFIQSTKHVSCFLPKTSIIPFNKIISIEEGVSYITTKEQIDQLLSKSGIDKDDVIIIYDINNSPYVTRLFWTLKVYGHEYVKILNGGLNAWGNAGFSTIPHPIVLDKTIYQSLDKNVNMIATIEHIKEAMRNENEIILDVRSNEEYNGGHIPGSINIPYRLALNPNGLFKTYQQLQTIYHPKGITPDKVTIYVYCTSGFRSSFTYFVLHELLGYNNVKVYDGSLDEYSKSKLPIVS